MYYFFPKQKLFPFSQIWKKRTESNLNDPFGISNLYCLLIFQMSKKLGTIYPKLLQIYQKSNQTLGRCPIAVSSLSSSRFRQFRYEIYYSSPYQITGFLFKSNGSKSCNIAYANKLEFQIVCRGILPESQSSEECTLKVFIDFCPVQSEFLTCSFVY